MAVFAPAGIGVAARLGFDTTISPPWVMVPSGGTKTVNLSDGTGLSLRFRKVFDPGGAGVVTFTESPGLTPLLRLIRLAAAGPGTGLLDAVDGNGRVQASLEVTVKDRRSLRVAAFYIVDKSLRPTLTSVPDGQHIIEVANKLYLPQTNTELVDTVHFGLKLPFDLANGFPVETPEFNAPRSFFRATSGPLPCISSREPKGLECLPEEAQGKLTQADFLALRNYQIQCHILRQVRADRDYHIFFVRSFERSNGPFITGAFTPSKLGNKVAVNACFIPSDHVTGQVLAHELGHFLLTPNPAFLNAGGHSTTQGDLMLERPGPDDLRIPKNQSNVMNTSGVV